MRRLGAALGIVLGLGAMVQGGERDVFGDGPRVGEMAPPLHLAKVLNAPAGAAADWESLKGKVVVLDFWATWCPSCVMCFPHMNKVIEEMKGEPVQFIAITAEPEEVVARFMKDPVPDYEKLDAESRAMAEPLVKMFRGKDPVKAWIGLDDLTGHDPGDYFAGRTVSGYFFYGVPHCVVVDKEGRIAAYCHPIELNAAYLRAIAVGAHPPMPEPDLPADQLKEWRASKVGDEWHAAPIRPRNPVFEASIRRSREWESPTTRPTGKFERPNPLAADRVELRLSRVTLGQALEAASKVRVEGRGAVPVVEFEVGSALPGELYDFEFSVPLGAFAGVFEGAVQATFDLDVQKGVRKQSVVHLRKAGEAKGERLPAGANELDVAHGSIRVSGQNGMGVASLGMVLGQDFKKAVIVEPGVDRTADVAVRWDSAGGYETFAKALREQAGLELVPEELAVDVIRMRAKAGG